MISNRREALRISSPAETQLTHPRQLGCPIGPPTSLKINRFLSGLACKTWSTDMSYTENLWLFFILLFGIIAVPGMDMLFVLANALTGGGNRGLAATAGIML